MVSEKVVTPVKTGVQGIYKILKILDSGFRRNDEKPQIQAFYEIGKFEMVPKKLCAKAKEFSHRLVGAIRESLLQG
jgi:hypothetical protein